MLSQSTLANFMSHYDLCYCFCKVRNKRIAEYFYTAYYVPDTILSVLQYLANLTLLTILWYMVYAHHI